MTSTYVNINNFKTKTMETLNDLIEWIKTETEWNPEKRMIDSVRLLNDFIQPRLAAETEKLKQLEKQILQTI